jgi:hypothetical protein
VSGLQLLISLLSNIRWSSLAIFVTGESDMYNLMSAGLPILVNSAECESESLLLLEVEDE